VTALFRVLFEIASLRSGPQVLPASTLLFGLVAGGYLLAKLVVLTLASPDVPRPLLVAGFDLALDAAVLWAILRLADRQARFVQSLTALYGVGILLNAALLPGALLARHGGGPLVTLGLLLALVVFAWSIVVIGHVLRHALELGAAPALALAVGWTLLSVFIGQSLGAS